MAASAALFPSEIIGDSSPFRFYSGPIKPLARQDRHFVRSLEERFPEPPADEAARVFGQQVVKLRSLHHGSPTSPDKNKGEAMERSSGAATRTIRDRAKPLKDRNEIAAEVARCLKTDFDHLKARNKEIARKAEASPRTVEAWIDGISPPGLEYVMRLLPHSPSLRKLMARQMTLDPDLDPEAYRAFLELMRMVQR
jgi:hypothetical protein